MSKRPSQFDKFSKKKSNAAIKEEFRQEKRKWKKEREEFFEKKKAGVGSLPAGRQVGNKQSESGKKDSVMPLNKFIAHSGVCGRREAAEMVKNELVKVNGVVVTEPGNKVFLAKILVYLLLNKPKDYISTTNDPQERKTLLDLIRRATPERVYPVGRLDRNTSGLLLFTNDGELAQRLSHPSNEIKKIYSV